MSIEDRDYYREKMQKVVEEYDKPYREPLSKDKFPIWHVIIVVTLIVWFTIFLFFYIIPIAMVSSILAPVEKILSKEVQNISNIPQTYNVPQINTHIQSSEQPIPENGSCKMFYSQGKAVATFKVIAEPYHHYFVKLVDHFDNPVLNIFIKAGNTAKIRVPLGVYELKWICGEKWYGNNDLFGGVSGYRKADKPVKFYEEETNIGNKIIGNTVNFNLIKGNTPSIKTSINEF
jgi:hypothetical protein